VAFPSRFRLLLGPLGGPHRRRTRSAHFRLAAGQAKPAVAKLVADGELERVDVQGWSAPAYLPAGQTIPRRNRGTALLCPFDR
jgi:uncharacterized protein YcaQ